MTDIVGDHILEDANIQMISEKLGKGSKATTNVTIRRFESNEETAELKESVAKYRKRVKELEDYTETLQTELTTIQDKLMSEMEEKNKVDSLYYPISI